MPHKPLQTYDRKMKRFVTASESKAVTAEGISNNICIDEFDIAIELKCTRDSLSAKKLSEEVASDIVHYDNKNIFFLIYDKARIIDNIDVFRDTYEKTDMSKNVKVFVML